jgi:hypothetical protein
MIDILHQDYLIYNRGSKDDWDNYANITQDPTWSWSSVKQYMSKVEKMVPPNDGSDAVCTLHLPPIHHILTRS